MKQYIKKLLISHLEKGFARKPVEDCLPFGLSKNSNGMLRSFGTKNPDGTFYVIWRSGMGSGFFSNFSHVLCHLKLADEAGMIPVVDFQNFPTLYNDSSIGTPRNAWEYYFMPVTPYPLEEVYQSRNVFFCSGSFPPGMSFSITQVDGLHPVFVKYVRVQNTIESKVSEYASRLLTDRTLGIHFRGQEQKRAPGHSFPPTERQMFRQTDTILEKHDISSLFLVTEDQRYLDLFIRRYGKRVAYTDSFRTYGENAYNMNPRDHHRYLLGLNVLIDATLLSQCRGLLCGDSNVSEYARFINHGRYEFVHTIYNGVNSSNPLVARYLYDLKKHLPVRLGGLSDQVSIAGA